MECSAQGHLMILTILRCQWPGTMRPVAQAVPRLAMFGHICQLHYHSGGVVAYRSQNGTAAKVQFHTVRTGPPLKIGQAVTFSVANGDAINITAVDAGGAAVASSRSPEPIGLRKHQRLQQEIAKFRNATLEEQLDWLRHAEAQLHRLLQNKASMRAMISFQNVPNTHTHEHRRTDAHTHTHACFFWGRHPLISSEKYNLTHTHTLYNTIYIHFG